MAEKPPFLRLPAELRGHIYELVLTKEEPVKMAGWRGRARASKRRTEMRFLRWSGLVLVKTCKQIRGECLPVFYSSNTFQLESHILGVNSIRNDSPLDTDTDAIKSAIRKLEKWPRSLGMQARNLRHIIIDLGRWETCYPGLSGSTVSSVIEQYRHTFHGLGAGLTFTIAWEWSVHQGVFETFTLLSIPLHDLANARSWVEKEIFEITNLLDAGAKLDSYGDDVRRS